MAIIVSYCLRVVRANPPPKPGLIDDFFVFKPSNSVCEIAATPRSHTAYTLKLLLSAPSGIGVTATSCTAYSLATAPTPLAVMPQVSLVFRTRCAFLTRTQNSATATSNVHLDIGTSVGVRAAGGPSFFSSTMVDHTTFGASPTSPPLTPVDEADLIMNVEAWLADREHDDAREARPQVDHPAGTPLAPYAQAPQPQAAPFGRSHGAQYQEFESRVASSVRMCDGRPGRVPVRIAPNLRQHPYAREQNNPGWRHVTPLASIDESFAVEKY